MTADLFAPCATCSHYRGEHPDDGPCTCDDLVALVLAPSRWERCPCTRYQPIEGNPMTDTPAPELAEQSTVPTTERRHDRGFPVRNVRMPDAEWARVRGEAERTGTTASTIVRDALDAYLDRRP